MLKNKLIVIIVVLVVALLFTIMIARVEYKKTIEYQLSKYNIKYDDIFYVKKVGNDILFFHKLKQNFYPGQLGLLKFEKNAQRRLWSEDVFATNDTDFSVDTSFCNSKRGKIVLLYGIINNPNINKIEVIENNLDQKYAEIVHIEGYRIWFYEGEGGTFNFKVYDEKGEEIMDEK